MPTIPLRFGNGQALEASPAERTQTGYRSMKNVRVDRRDVCEKRPGANEITRSDSADPESLISADDVTALFFREDELCMETRSQLYSRRDCVGAGAQSPGTATPTEISDTIAALNDKYRDVWEIPRPQSPLANTTIALARLDIAPDSGNPMVLTDGPFSVTTTVAFSAGILRLTWFGDAAGSYDFPADCRVYRYFIKTAATARLVVARGNTASNRSALSVWEIEASNAQQTVVVTLDNTVLNVVGSPSASCWTANESGIGYLQETGGIFNIRDWDNGRVYSLSAFEKSLLDSSTSNRFRVAYDASQLGTFGPWFACAPLDSSLPAGSRLYVYDLPSASGPAGTSVPIDVVDWTNAAVVEMASQMSTPIIAIQDMGADPVTVKIISSIVQWNGPATGIESQFDNSTGTVVYRATINGVPLAAVDLGADATLSTFHEWRAGGADAIVGCNLKSSGSAGIWTQLLGDVAPTPRVSIPTAYSATAVVSANWYGVLIRTATDHIFHYSADASTWASVNPGGLTIAVSPNVGGDNLSATLVDSGPSFRLRAFQYGDTDKLVNSYSYDHGTATLANLRKDGLSSHPGGVEIAHLELGLFPRALVAMRQYSDQKNLVVYEQDSPDLWVRVSPPSVALPGGDWAARGSWTRGRLRSPTIKEFQNTVAEVAAARITSAQDPNDQCVHALAEVTGSGLYTLVYGNHLETSALIDADGTDPHVARFDDTTAALTYVNASDELVYQYWSTGESLSFANVGMVLAGDHVYDADAGRTSEDGFGCWHGKTAATTAELDVRPGSLSSIPPSSTNVSPSLWTTIQAVSVYALEDTSLDGPKVVLAQAGVKDGTIWVRVLAITTDPPVTTVWSHEFDTGLTTATWTATAVSVGALLSSFSTTAEVWLEVQDLTPERQVRAYRVTSTPTVVQINKWRRSAIMGSMREIDPLTPRLVGVLSATDSGGKKALRSGYFLVCASTNEIIGRADTGNAEDASARLLQRNQVSNLNYDGTDLVIGVRRFQNAETPTVSQFLRWDFSQRPNRPAVASGVLVSAHGGYPRAYDGADTREYDWHELPQFVSVTALAGGSLTTGSYGVAVSYEEGDAAGQFYRCAPTFATVSLTAGQTLIQIKVRPLVFSERINPRLVIWRTLVNGGTYYKAAEVAARQDLDEILINLTAADSTLSAAETLDQVSGGVLVSTPAPITDFVAYADSRFWGLDPERPSLIRYTIPAAEGLSPHFNLGLAIETPNAQPATALTEMDGRIIAFSSSSIYYTPTGGPDARGVGSYTMSLIPAEIGTNDINTTALIPDGVFFASASGPRLLSRGLQVVRFGDPIERFYEVDGDVITTAYWVPSEGSLRLGSLSGRVLRYHSETQRWAEDTGRQSLDCAVSRSAVYAVLTADGRVLVEDDPTLFTDGGLVYTSSITTPWLHVPSESRLVHQKLTIHRITAWGQRRGSHSLLFTAERDYGALPNITWTLDQSKIDAQPFYLATVSGVGTTGHSFSLTVEDDAPPNSTFSFEGIDVEFSQEGDKGAVFGTEHVAVRNG